MNREKQYSKTEIKKMSDVLAQLIKALGYTYGDDKLDDVTDELTDFVLKAYANAEITVFQTYDALKVLGYEDQTIEQKINDQSWDHSNNLIKNTPTTTFHVGNPIEPIGE
jgi:hypothetical protein